jgi:hypothetical protein
MRVPFSLHPHSTFVVGGVLDDTNCVSECSYLPVNIAFLNCKSTPYYSCKRCPHDCSTLILKGGYEINI